MSADIHTQWPTSTAALWADGAGQQMGPLALHGPRATGTCHFCVYCQEKQSREAILTILTQGCLVGREHPQHRCRCFSVMKEASTAAAGVLLAHPQCTSYWKGFPQRLWLGGL